MKGDKLLKYVNPKFFVPFILFEIFSFLVGIVFVSLLFVIIISSTPVYLFRFILSKTIKYFRPDLGKLVTSRGQFASVDEWTSLKRPPRANIVAAMIVEGHLSVTEARERAEKNLIGARDDQGNEKYPEIKQYCTIFMGFKVWKWDPHFSIDNHLKVIDNTDSVFTPSDLRDMIETLANQPFHPKRSPWEIIVVYNYVSHNHGVGENDIRKTIFIAKFHHVLADGFGALFTVMSALCSPIPVIPKAQFPDRGKCLKFLFNLTYPLRVIREFSQHVVLTSFQDNPWRIPDDKKSWKQIYQSSPPISVSTIKVIKNRYGVSFTSVMHSCLASAMAKGLEAQHGSAILESVKRMPSIFMLPLPGHPFKLRNYTTGAMIAMPIMKMDPKERLLQCERDIERAKKSTMPSLGTFLPVLVGSMCTRMVKFLATNRTTPTGFSNVPLGDVEYELCGRKVVDFKAIVTPGEGVIGLGCLIFSYADTIQFGMVGESAIFSRSDLDLMQQAIVDEIDFLYRDATV